MRVRILKRGGYWYVTQAQWTHRFDSFFQARNFVRMNLSHKS